jgi:hypothetical protein
LRICSMRWRLPSKINWCSPEMVSSLQPKRQYIQAAPHSSFTEWKTDPARPAMMKNVCRTSNSHRWPSALWVRSLKGHHSARWPFSFLWLGWDEYSKIVVAFTIDTVQTAKKIDMYLDFLRP